MAADREALPEIEPEHQPRVPHLVRFLGLRLALGAAFGVAFAAMLVLANVSGLNDLIRTTGYPLVALAMLYFVNVLTFGSLAMGIAVMTLPLDPPAGDDDGGESGEGGDRAGRID